MHITGRKVALVGLLCMAVVLLSVLFLSQPGRLSIEELRPLPPKPPAPAYFWNLRYQGALTRWQLENCAIFPGYLAFRVTREEFQSWKSYPKVSFLLGADGKVDRVQLLLGSGNATLDLRMLKWLRTVRFSLPKGCSLAVEAEGLIDLVSEDPAG